MNAFLPCNHSCVSGISKASVTTGLIGGRLGNKGGVGISVKIDGATFLFLNAHLAGKSLSVTLSVTVSFLLHIAHEGKVNHRLANLAKIKVIATVIDMSSDFIRTAD